MLYGCIGAVLKHRENHCIMYSGPKIIMRFERVAEFETSVRTGRLDPLSAELIGSSFS